MKIATGEDLLHCPLHCNYESHWIKGHSEIVRAPRKDCPKEWSHLWITSESRWMWKPSTETSGIVTHPCTLLKGHDGPCLIVFGEGE